MRMLRGSRGLLLAAVGAGGLLLSCEQGLAFTTTRLPTSRPALPCAVRSSLEVYPSAEDRSSRMEVDSIKNQLLQVSAMTDRGQQATPEQRDEVELLVGRLQEVTPVGASFKNSDMVGTWTLVYSSSQLFRSSPFFASAQALLGRKELTDRMLSLAGSLPTSRLGQVKQIVDENNKSLVSQVEVKVGPCPTRLLFASENRSS
jgi:hypothetical protein